MIYHLGPRAKHKVTSHVEPARTEIPSVPEP